MNNLLNTAVGIDKTILDIQTDLYNQLSDVWAGEIDGYGRVYKNPTNTGEDIPDYYRTSKIVTPSWYNAKLQDYEDTFFDDNKAGVFCFLTQENDDTQDSIVYTSDVKIAFMVDLSKIYPTLDERQDSRAQRDVVEILRNFSFERYEITGVERRIDFVFREYTTSAIRFDDMHPLHCFAVKIKLEYFLTDKC
jgi:hypothetical protein|tara:strand:+ start:4459 stop:5034 length:576 start_codon:yes stop_codon:yes gene_type:complete